MTRISKYVVCTLFLTLAACEKETPWTTSSPSPLASARSQPVGSPSPSLPSLGGSNCETVPTTEMLDYDGTIIAKQLPMAGLFVIESHIKTAGEKYSGKNGFPRTRTEGINAHLALHHEELSKHGIDSRLVYDDAEDDGEEFKRVWTRGEFGGTIGQGSISESPSIEEETWTLNMQWKKAPVAKYLVSYGGKHAAVMAKYETGPDDKKWLGGMQPAPFYALGADDESQIMIGKLKDQSTPLGPIVCNRKEAK